MSSTQRNYYEILNSTSNASFDELKRNYKHLILQCHPDKLQQDKLKTAATTSTVATAVNVDVDPNVSVAHDDGDVDNSEFIIINEAWNTLKDPVKRKHYDAELLLMKFQAHSNVFEHLTLADMEEHEANMENDTTEHSEDTMETFYTYNCRCGGQYIIDESAATDNGIYKSYQKAAISGQQQPQTHNNDCANACQDFNVADVHDKNKVTDTSDCEVMVECSECSLVIILSNVKQQNASSTLS